MTVIVYNEHGQSIPALLISYDSTGQELERDTIQSGGAELAQLANATQWRFQADGYQDATVHDLYNYGQYAMELIPKYRWVAPVLLGLSAYWLLTKALKF